MTATDSFHDFVGQLADALAVQLRFVAQRAEAIEHAIAATPAESPARAELVAEREAAQVHRLTVQERVALQEEARAERRVVLPLTMQGRDLTRGGSDTQVRRAAAGAAVDGLVAGLAIAAFSFRRRTA
ncbi:hypothetical protein [Nocardioides immobilis]|uniref:hypothetical protein n=1 Tax=Nocardioides immobilis TaxID=2049295 RepID=UPI0011C48030|nr:hypothetical protein [Nocardioides immobilis]